MPPATFGLVPASAGAVVAGAVGPDGARSPLEWCATFLACESEDLCGLAPMLHADILAAPRGDKPSPALATGSPVRHSRQTGQARSLAQL